jgi:hypothetical protein
MANKQRGEVEIKLAGETLKLTPSFEGIVECEERAGVGLSGLLSRISDSKAGLRDIVPLVYGGLLGSGVLAEKKWSYADVGRLCSKEGCRSLLGQVTEFLVNCYSGQTEEAEADPKKA